MTTLRVLLLTPIWLGAAAGLPAAPEALEITLQSVGNLPKGKEADGIIGDFVLRNDKVEAVISQNASDRRANMSTYYGADGIVPGCLFDLTRRGAANDQLIIFSPGGQRGKVSWVRIAKDGKDGEAAVETVITAANNGGVFKSHTYRIKEGWMGVEIETMFRNESEKPVTVSADDRWGNFSKSGDVFRIRWGDAIDPADKSGYAADNLPNEVKLQPGESKTLARFLTVGSSPLQAVGQILERRGETSEVEVTVTDEAGVAVPTARISFFLDNKEVPAYPNAEGLASFRLPGGEYKVKVTDLGRAAVIGELLVNSGQSAKLALKLGPQSAVAFDIQDEQARSLPCKAMFERLDAKPGEKLDLGPSNRAHGCVDQWHNETGKFRVALPPGKYKVTVTRGMEYSHLEKEFELLPGKVEPFLGVLKRQVDTTGWVSADFHNHSTPSGDNTCGTDDRIINLAAEHIEFAPCTEHNRLYDWAPHIEKLGLKSWMSTISGMELTGRGEHLNSFPFTPEWYRQDNGAPKWVDDTRINAIVLRDWQTKEKDRYVQVNHPNLDHVFVDRDQDGVADDGFIGVGQYVDCWEIENTMDDGVLQKAPFRLYPDRDNPLIRKVRYNRQFIWLQLLNQGHRLKAIAAADAHTVWGNGVGGWRNFFPSRTDDPSMIDWREMSQQAKAGRCLITNGPFLQATRNGDTVAGAEISVPGGEVSMHVKVQCNDWVKIDRVLVLVNGGEVPEAQWTREKNAADFHDGVIVFDRDIVLKLKEDAHLIVVAYGDTHTIQAGFGTSQQRILKPCAYLNPCYVDTDGGGFKANKDTLGFDIPVSGMNVEKVQKILTEHGLPVR